MSGDSIKPIADFYLRELPYERKDKASQPANPTQAEFEARTLDPITARSFLQTETSMHLDVNLEELNYLQTLLLIDRGEVEKNKQAGLDRDELLKWERVNESLYRKVRDTTMEQERPVATRGNLNEVLSSELRTHGADTRQAALGPLPQLPFDINAVIPMLTLLEPAAVTLLQQNAPVIIHWVIEAIKAHAERGAQSATP